jgi:hypothetical protein
VWHPWSTGPVGISSPPPPVQAATEEATISAAIHLLGRFVAPLLIMTLSRSAVASADS